MDLIFSLFQAYSMLNDANKIGESVADWLFETINDWSRRKSAATIEPQIERIGTITEEGVRERCRRAFEGKKSKIPEAKREELTGIMINMVRNIRTQTSNGTLASDGSFLRSERLLDQLLRDVEPVRHVNEPVAPGSPWILQHHLGMGSFGEVWLARNPHYPTLRAYKFFTPRRVGRLARARATKPGRDPETTRRARPDRRLRGRPGRRLPLSLPRLRVHGGRVARRVDLEGCRPPPRHAGWRDRPPDRHRPGRSPRPGHPAPRHQAGQPPVDRRARPATQDRRLRAGQDCGIDPALAPKRRSSGRSAGWSGRRFTSRPRPSSGASSAGRRRTTSSPSAWSGTSSSSARSSGRPTTSPPASPIGGADSPHHPPRRALPGPPRPPVQGRPRGPGEDRGSRDPGDRAADPGRPRRPAHRPRVPGGGAGQRGLRVGLVLRLTRSRRIGIGRREPECWLAGAEGILGSFGDRNRDRPGTDPHADRAHSDRLDHDHRPGRRPLAGRGRAGRGPGRSVLLLGPDDRDLLPGRVRGRGSLGARTSPSTRRPTPRSGRASGPAAAAGRPTRRQRASRPGWSPTRAGRSRRRLPTRAR